MSNLIHCYDEHSCLSVTDRFVREQSALPLKSRFKIAAVNVFIESLVGTGDLLFAKNADFHSLDTHDQSLLVHTKLKYVGAFGGCFALHSLNLYDNRGFCQSIELAYGLDTITSSRRTAARLDADAVFMKLIMAIVLFSTMDLTFFANAPPVNFHDVKAVVRIQNVYTEVAWRYLVYKYGSDQAVVRFSNLIRCIFAANYSLACAFECGQYQDVVDVVIEKIEQTLSIRQ